MAPRSAPLPALYATWLEEALGAVIPRESRVVCEPCAMCELRPGPVPPFSPDVKCCSYWPGLPSFLVGRVLQDSRAEAEVSKSMIRAFITADRCVTPLGVFPSPARAARYEAVSDERFGIDRELLCPYFDEGARNCTIWPHREAVCSTYYCLHERHARGYRFWWQLRELLVELEQVLVIWCAVELGLGDGALNELLRADGKPRSPEGRELRGWIEPDGEIEPDLARRLWGCWRGREEEYFLSCAERVGELRWADLRALGGVRLEVYRRRALAALKRLDEREVPEQLCQGLYDVTDLEGDEGRVTIHNEELVFDPLLLPRAVAEALSAFDGRSTSEAVAFARERHGVELDEELLRLFVECGVLGAPDGHDLPPVEQDGSVERESRLRFFRGFRRAGIEWSLGYDEGQPVLNLNIGHKEIVFDKPALFTFGRELHRHRHGFRAGEAADWGGADWEKVRELLEAIVEAGLLRHLP